MRDKDILLYKKTTGNNTYWYFYFYYTQDGINFKKSKISSTGIKYNEDDIEGSKKEALKIARFKKFQFESQNYKIQKKKQNRLYFEKYTKTFFIYDMCAHTQEEIMKGRELSRSWVEKQRDILTRVFWPEIGSEDMNTISSRKIEKALMEIKKKKNISNNTINKYLAVIKVIFKYAYKNEDIQKDPAASIKNWRIKKTKREILTIDEFQTLFLNNAVDRVWKSNIIQYTLCLTAALTGCRMGELQALTADKIDPEKMVITVNASWERGFGIKNGTKNGEDRIVPVPLYAINFLNWCRRINGAGYIFSFCNGEKPINHRNITKWFNLSLYQIGISDTERKIRNLTFHSLRHFANSIFSNQAEQRIVMNVIGHKSVSMNKHYDHVDDKEYYPIRKAQNKLVKLL